MCSLNGYGPTECTITTTLYDADTPAFDGGEVPIPRWPWVWWRWTGRRANRRLLAWVRLHEGHQPDAAFCAQLCARLQVHMVPQVIPIEGFFPQAWRQIDMDQLSVPAMRLSDAHLPGLSGAGDDPDIAVVQEIFGKVLGREGVGADESFFDLGGRSGNRTQPQDALTAPKPRQVRGRPIIAPNARHEMIMKPRRSYPRRRRTMSKLRGIVVTTLMAISAMFLVTSYAPDAGQFLVTGQAPAPDERPRITRGGDAWSGSSRTPTTRQSSSEGRAAEPGALLIDVVTRVRDGDTIVVGLIPIRIANLDCAETGSAAGERATQRMSALVRGQQVICVLEGRRSWDREVGLCALPDNRDLGEILIAERLCTRWR